MLYIKNDDKEYSLGRKAASLGLYLRKSASRSCNHCGYMISNLYTNSVICGADYELDLDEAEQLLNLYEKGKNS